ncbi:lipid A deacylase LpxR family protein [Paraflavitalea speifideaquila]|uniref:lipid A deacylase LpxR family protein n=1 Tax=Paraflavitalea speifideaquila TaxID=3076558 RepID=UPI0028ED450D|nr:lipid A deacylase LpxR family protein [Paraflavitalea speifideiaquila]
MFKVYEDNDLFNFYNIGADGGYTNGTRLEFSWLQQKPSFTTRLMPKAGIGSINTTAVGLMQIIITPDNIVRYRPDPADYPYSGALFITHSLHSSNPTKKISLQTEWLLGVMGPPSLAQETQELMHRIIQGQKPRGWSYQQPTDLLLNYQFTVNKGLAHVQQWAELIGSGQVYAGTMTNGAALYATLRLGKMQPYFNGYNDQFTKGKGATGNKWQLYFMVQPGIALVLNNALLEGGVFNHNTKHPGYSETQYVRVAEKQQLITSIDIGFVVSRGNIGLSFTQKALPHPSKACLIWKWVISPSILLGKWLNTSIGNNSTH